MGSLPLGGGGGGGAVLPRGWGGVFGGRSRGGSLISIPQQEVVLGALLVPGALIRPPHPTVRLRCPPQNAGGGRAGVLSRGGPNAPPPLCLIRAEVVEEILAVAVLPALAVGPCQQQGDVGLLLAGQEGHGLLPVLHLHPINLDDAVALTDAPILGCNAVGIHLPHVDASILLPIGAIADGQPQLIPMARLIQLHLLIFQLLQALVVPHVNGVVIVLGGVLGPPQAALEADVRLCPAVHQPHGEGRGMGGGHSIQGGSRPPPRNRGGPSGLGGGTAGVGAAAQHLQHQRLFGAPSWDPHPGAVPPPAKPLPHLPAR